MGIRRLFKLLEYLAQGKQFPMEKLSRHETANVMVNSTSFEDPKDVNDRENIRLKDVPACPGDSGIEGGRNFS